MIVPSATYRIQFSASFGFADARGLVPYLDSLGITHLYASPLLKARTGSTHGYDMTDPTRLDPELGTRGDFEDLVEALHRHDMGLILDVVPNHMAMSGENPWWVDVLENGQASRFAAFFDIDWTAPTLEGKVLLPILGAPYAEVLERGELTASLEPGGLVLRYHDQTFPVGPKSYPTVLAPAVEELSGRLGEGHPSARELREALRAAAALPGRSDTRPEAALRRAKGTETLKRRLWALYGGDQDARDAIDRRLRVFAGERRSESRLDELDRLVGEQAYVLAHWRAAPEEIDYRRFFDIADLVSIRQQRPEVFEATHALLLQLHGAGAVQGFRIDHVDGLADPQGYLDRLRSAAGPQAYIVVEKILADGETLPEAWPVAGTTGYEFAVRAGDVFVDGSGLEALEGAFARLTGLEEPFEEVVHAQKRKVIDQLFASEVSALGGRLHRLARQDRWGRDLTSAELNRALVEVTAGLDVYRTYVRSRPVRPGDRRRIEHAVRRARRLAGGEVPAGIAFLRRVLLLELGQHPAPGKLEAWLALVMRWQQFTGPVMAKGHEDTALYVYNPLTSRNDVGSDPGATVGGVEGFHRAGRAAVRTRPHTMNATSTHDGKRSEDVRTRIDVLSELAGEWIDRVERWREWNGAYVAEVKGHPAPDPNEEWLLYQTLVGVWPLHRSEERDAVARVRRFMEKAAREAKVHTSWMDPDPAHERAVDRFVVRVLRRRNERFLSDIRTFAQRVAWYGALNGLSQVVMKSAAPGVPDFYQGTERWALSLVDPDNRRPVDFNGAAAALEELRGRARTGGAGLAAELLREWQDGRIKLLVTAAALEFRRSRPDLFTAGSYMPLRVPGRRAGHVLAFARRLRDEWAVAVVPRAVTRLAGPSEPPVGPGVWGRSALGLPAAAPDRWRNVLTGEIVMARARAAGNALPLREALAVLPVALLSGEPQGAAAAEGAARAEVRPG